MAEAQFTAEERAAFIARIATLPQKLRALVADLSEEQLTTHYLPHEWTVLQNVHHLYDAHINSYLRLKRILTEDNPTLWSLDQDELAELADYDMPIEDTLVLLEKLHARWVHLFNSLSDAQWLRIGTTAKSGRTLTPEDLVRIYADHGENHLDQITRTLAAK
ncbi:MAG: DinB family protein [Anaerolineae bacterium]|nr:DinB family protein [Anaerolineae bacterium]MCA9895667.1 DinB family protein [Anaerolineae bacterium]